MPEPEPAAWRSVRRWWNRVTATILALGALAGAIGAILALRPAPDPPDLKDVARIFIDADSPVPLSEGQALLRATLSEGAGSGGRQDRPSLVRRLQPDPSATSEADPTTGTSAPDPSSSSSSGTTASSSSDTTASSSGSTSSTPSTTGQPNSSRLGTTEIAPPAGIPQEKFRVRVNKIVELARERDSSLTGCSEDQDPSTCVAKVLSSGYAVGQDGQLVEPEVAAERLVKLFRDTRRTDGGGSGPSEPLGVFVTADLELIGLHGREVKLSWSMVGGREGNKRLHGNWLNANLAYILKAESDDATGVAAIWIPLPRSAGPYRIRVLLKVDGKPLASKISKPIS